ncbi:zinc finger protein basonuclin-2-like isoform X2 [Branchiostoma floridae]|uniref:Zinc finger protein basonuclin-2-like isoform X2 n=1 Tax=Branchiostoma floridae TaxID=7739 RepID=A0A9J7KD89_BRAFL|nr:zinc finger protein basonuclin-2-like isoform X2 [Branchiostoma floridae]
MSLLAEPGTFGTFGKFPATKAIRCTLPNCQCECFSPGKTQLRTCETCKHGWVAHALDKLSTRHLYTSTQPEIVQSNVVFDIASLVLYGTQATPIRLKILLDRLFSVLKQEEVMQILHGLGWTYEDYVRGYILQDCQGKVLEQWIIASRDEEIITMQQFLRFGETKSIVELMFMHAKDGSGGPCCSPPKTESDIRAFIESTHSRLRSPGQSRSPVLSPHTDATSTASTHSNDSVSVSVQPSRITTPPPLLENYPPASVTPNGLVMDPQLAVSTAENPSPTPQQALSPVKSEPGSRVEKSLTTIQQEQADIRAKLGLESSVNAPHMEAQVVPTSQHGHSHYAEMKLKSLRKVHTDPKRRWSMYRGHAHSNRVMCPSCGKSFYDKGTLKIHYSSVHLKIKHKCTIEGCNMVFSSLRSRNRHSANPNPRLHMPMLRKNREGNTNTVRNMIDSTKPPSSCTSSPLAQHIATTISPLTITSAPCTSRESSPPISTSPALTPTPHFDAIWSTSMFHRALVGVTDALAHMGGHTAIPMPINPTIPISSSPSPLPSVSLPSIPLPQNDVIPKKKSRKSSTPIKLTKVTEEMEDIDSVSTVVSEKGDENEVVEEDARGGGEENSTELSQEQVRKRKSKPPEKCTQEEDEYPESDSTLRESPDQLKDKKLNSYEEDEKGNSPKNGDDGANNDGKTEEMLEHKDDDCRKDEDKRDEQSDEDSFSCNGNENPGSGHTKETLSDVATRLAANFGLYNLGSEMSGVSSFIPVQKIKQEIPDQPDSLSLYGSFLKGSPFETSPLYPYLYGQKAIPEMSLPQSIMHSPYSEVHAHRMEVNQSPSDRSGNESPDGMSFNSKTCHVCGKTFKSTYSVKLHYKNVHLKEMHTCTVDGCNATFPSKRSRDRHSANINLHRKLLTRDMADGTKASFSYGQSLRDEFLAKIYGSHGLALPMTNGDGRIPDFSVLPHFGHDVQRIPSYREDYNHGIESTEGDGRNGEDLEDDACSKAPNGEVTKPHDVHDSSAIDLRTRGNEPGDSPVLEDGDQQDFEDKNQSHGSEADADESDDVSVTIDGEDIEERSSPDSSEVFASNGGERPLQLVGSSSEQSNTTSFKPASFYKNSSIVCNLCHKLYSNKSTLRVHYRTVHLREMHKCKVPGCNMMFSSVRSRNRHSQNPNLHKNL